MNKLIIRLATDQDNSSILKIPPYCRSKCKFPCYNEDVFIAESEGKILGAASVSSKNISFVLGDWNDDFEQRLGSLLTEVSGAWISKLFVLSEYRRLGIGTRLVEEVLKRIEKKNVKEVYAGINVKNEFREVSTRIFEKNGFKRVGSCICPLVNGYCRGALFKKTLVLDGQRQQ